MHCRFCGYSGTSLIPGNAPVAVKQIRNISVQGKYNFFVPSFPTKVRSLGENRIKGIVGENLKEDFQWNDLLQ